MGRTDEIQEQQQEFASAEQVKQPAEVEGPPAKMPRIDESEGGLTGAAEPAAVEAESAVPQAGEQASKQEETLQQQEQQEAAGEEPRIEEVQEGQATEGGEASEAKEEPHRPVTRLDDGTIDVQESLQSMRESNTPHTGEELYKDAVHPEAPQHEHHEKHGKSPRASSEGMSKPVTRLDDGTLNKEESLESMRESNTPHTGEQLYEDAVPAAEGTVKKTKGRGSKRSRRSA